MERLLPLLAAFLAVSLAVPAQATVPGYEQYVSQQLVQATDVNGDNDTTRQFIGEDLAFLLGAANALPNTGSFSPLAITQSASALTLSIGGGGQAVYTQFRLVDAPPTATLTIPANSSGATRVDVVSIQYTQIQKTGHTATVGTGTQTVYNIGEGLSYAYTQGTTTPPTGYVAFALVSVPNAAANAAACTVQILFNSVSSILTGSVSGGVTSINNQTGAVTLNAGTNVSITNVGNEFTINSTAATVGVTALNALTGSLSLTSSDSSVTITPSGTSINLQASFPSRVASLNGLSGTLSLTSSNLTVTPSGSTVDVEPAFMYDSSSTVRPSGKICAGTAITNSSSLVVVTCGTTVLGGEANFQDSSFSNAIAVAVKTISGNTITFGTRYINNTTGGTGTGAGVGITYHVDAY